MAKVHIYRPLGDHPPKTQMGDLELGKVHTIDEAKAAVYLKKGFAVLSDADAAAVRAGKPLQAQPAPRQERAKRETQKTAETDGGN